MEEPIFRYPTKKKIRKLIRIYGIEPTFIIFSDGYETGKRGGIFWRRNDLKISMYGIEEHFEKHNIEISKYKNYGEVHSIFFKKIEVKN
jgi:hypothetical protein